MVVILSERSESKDPGGWGIRHLEPGKISVPPAVGPLEEMEES